MKKYLCGFLGHCDKRYGNYCCLIPGACDRQIDSKLELKLIQACGLCAHRNVCKYREEFEKKKKDSPYIKLECKYFMH